MSRQKHTIETITAPLLLPIVSTVVGGASGGIIAKALSPFDPTLARSIVIVSYVVLGTGIPIAMFFTTLWLYRTAIVGLPAPGALPSLFLPLGPCGQGAFGLVLLGHVVRDLAYTHQVGFTIAPTSAASHADSLLRVADAVYAAGLVSGLLLWGLGLVWYALAMTITIDHAFRNRSYFSYTTFSIGWTAYTFPIGVWATASTQLAKELDSPAFKVIGTVVSLQVVLQWGYVFVMACWKGWHGAIFVAPELSEWEGGRPPLRWSRPKQGTDPV
jgi:tellurite resistance protein TehA-like permease